MKVTALIENTASRHGITAEHGLSLYVEAAGKRILFDMGQTDAFVENARILGVSLEEVDFAVLSHGHYDHGGGLEAFLRINKTAKVYLSRHAFQPHYNGTEKYIGLDLSLKSNDRLVFTDDFYKINDNFCLYSCNNLERKHTFLKNELTVKTDSGFVHDDFRHEQYLLVCENEKRVLFSGCSHNGVVNIQDRFNPHVLIGGFHLSKEEPDGEAVRAVADILDEYETKYYTCHCTGVPQYLAMKERMGASLGYLSASDTLIL